MSDVASRYSEEEKAGLIRQILDLIESGLSMRKACEAVGVPRQTFEDWTDKDETLSGQYTRAREKRADHIFEEMLVIADTPVIATVETAKEWGTEIKTGDAVDHRKLQIETRKWMLGKMAPKKYGSSVDQVETVDLARVLSDIASRLPG